MKEKVELIQHAYKTNPNAAEIVKAAKAEMSGKQIYDVEDMREKAKAFINDINEFMQEYRVFCVSIHIDSKKMWSTYAQDHKGIVLRIEPNVAKDSKFQLFRPVEYREARPPLYDDTLDFIAGSLFGDQEARRKAMIEKIVYSKTLPWRHEGEYRLAIPLRKGEAAMEYDEVSSGRNHRALSGVRDDRSRQERHRLQGKGAEPRNHRFSSCAGHRHEPNLP